MRTLVRSRVTLMRHEAKAAASVAEGDPGDLVGAEHPGGRVGGVSGFLHEVGGVHIVVGGVGVHCWQASGSGLGGAGACQQ